MDETRHVTSGGDPALPNILPSSCEVRVLVSTPRAYGDFAVSMPKADFLE